MMDLSDGLDTDLSRLMKASRRGAEVLVENIPISKSLQKYCDFLGVDPTCLSIAGGEDYCLLGTADRLVFAKIQRGFLRRFARPLFPIGTVLKNKGDIKYKICGSTFVGEFKGFQHFQ